MGVYEAWGRLGKGLCVGVRDGPFHSLGSTFRSLQFIFWALASDFVPCVSLVLDGLKAKWLEQKELLQRRRSALETSHLAVPTSGYEIIQPRQHPGRVCLFVLPFNPFLFLLLLLSFTFFLREHFSVARVLDS